MRMTLRPLGPACLPLAVLQPIGVRQEERLLPGRAQSGPLQSAPILAHLASLVRSMPPSCNIAPALSSHSFWPYTIFTFGSLIYIETWIIIHKDI